MFNYEYLDEAVKIINLLNRYPWVHVFLIFYATIQYIYKACLLHSEVGWLFQEKQFLRLSCKLKHFLHGIISILLQTASCKFSQTCSDEIGSWH